GDAPALVDRQAGKVKSDEAELWVRLGRGPKLVGRVRTDWRFRGLLGKFKLEGGPTDEQALGVAERSGKPSQGGPMGANTLEGAPIYAFIGAGQYERVSRAQLAARLAGRLEGMHSAKGG